MISEQKPSEEAKELQRRAATVFDLAYRRFRDLQKAEEQAREAQIEVALERIRARALAMHSSDELIEVAKVLREQMAGLGQPELEASVVHLYEGNVDVFEAWYAYSKPNEFSVQIISGKVKVNKKTTEWAREAMAKYKTKAWEYTIIAKGNKLAEWYKELEIIDSRVLDYDEKGKIIVPEILYYHFSNFSGGSLLMTSEQKPSVVAQVLQRRAATVFDLAYRRFRDLKKAEAQAREAEIEAALERIRSKAMAMHTSEDLIGVADTLREQMGKLGQPGLDSSGIHFYDDSLGKIKIWWVYGEFDNPSAELINGFSEVDYDSCQYTTEVVHHYHSRQEQFIIHSGKTKLVEWYGVMVKIAPKIIEYDELGQLIVPNELHYCYSRFPGGALTMASEKPFSQEAMKLQKRAAQVFELAYRRFLDLQKAEDQAREAQIYLKRVKY